MRQTIKTLADEIRRRWPELDVKVEQGFACTDRKIPGTRLRHPGKGRLGSRIIVRDPTHPVVTPGGFTMGELLLDQSPERSPGAGIEPVVSMSSLAGCPETYRQTDEVRDWIDQRVHDQKKSRKAASR